MAKAILSQKSCPTLPLTGYPFYRCQRRPNDGKPSAQFLVTTRLFGLQQQQQKTPEWPQLSLSKGYRRTGKGLTKGGKLNCKHIRLCAPGLKRYVKDHDCLKICN
ncbi:Hypothetical predicted protein [Podarcis lilfordi]|uniref:Uncharacterized protein n=1 Tax=Podarcis lilfordi TaxID=74358 RepID=A0AA35KA50_9SAUR|nr:Hypothetical predicted protein [Podarcis lilfordi]